MATSGQILKRVSDYYNLFIKFSWKRISYLISDNSSTIEWTLSLQSTNQAISSTAPKEWEVIINGEIYSDTNSVGIGKNETKILATGQTKIKHNTDRTKTFSFSFTQVFDVLDINVATGSGTGTLDPIPKEVTIVSAPNFTDDDNPMITYSNPAGELVESLQACIANENGSSIIVGYRDISKTASSYTFNLTDSERSQLRAASVNSLTLPVRFYIKSVVDGVTYHSYSGVKTLTINATAPTVTASVLDTNPDTFNLTGDSNKMIRYRNAMLCQITATGSKGATIKEYSITCGEHTSSSDNVVFQDVSSNVFTFKATDSRGLSATKTVTLPMVEYVKPTCVQKVTMVMESDTDTQANITINGKYFDGNFGEVDNTLSIQTRHRANSGSWSAWSDITPLALDISNGTYSLSAEVSGFDANGTYEFQSRAVDKVFAVESVVGSVTLKPVFDWGKTDFNFNVPVTIEGNPLNDFVIETGTESMGSNGTWYWRKWKSGRAECYGRRNFGAMAVTTAWGNLFRSETFTQSLPSGLFTAVPEVIDIGYSSGNYGGWIVRHENSAPTASSTGSFILVRPASATLSSSYIGFNVIGRWK